VRQGVRISIAIGLLTSVKDRITAG